jgi:hypothetical protein
MPDKISSSKKSIEQIEEVILRVIEAAEKITSRLFLYVWALWHTYWFFAGKH